MEKAICKSKERSVGVSKQRKRRKDERSLKVEKQTKRNGKRTQNKSQVSYRILLIILLRILKL